MGWKLEVAKMFMYISFPVGIFHYFNQLDTFQEWAKKAKEEYYPPENREIITDVNNFIHEFNAAAENRRLKEMERQYKNEQ